MMLRNETWMVALEALWANKVRAFLTTLGVVIGSACIVLVVTVALSGRRYVIEQIEGVGSIWFTRGWISIRTSRSCCRTNCRSTT